MKLRSPTLEEHMFCLPTAFVDKMKPQSLTPVYAPPPQCHTCHSKGNLNAQHATLVAI
jgi:hypothetical protein